MSSEIDDYVQKQRSPQKEICQRLKRLIVKTFPDVKEVMKWGVPTFGNGKFYIVALKDHVNLGFSIKGLSKEELVLFQGTGKTMRHLRISSLEEMDEDKIVELLKVVKSK